MASPRLVSPHYPASSTRRYRRSPFNGAKQLATADAKRHRVLWVMGLLATALVVALVVVVVHVAGAPK